MAQPHYLRQSRSYSYTICMVVTLTCANHHILPLSVWALMFFRRSPKDIVSGRATSFASSTTEDLDADVRPSVAFGHSTCGTAKTQLIAQPPIGKSIWASDSEHNHANRPRCLSRRRRKNRFRRKGQHALCCLCIVSVGQIVHQSQLMELASPSAFIFIETIIRV